MADDSHLIGQSEIEELLKQAQAAGQPAGSPQGSADASMTQAVGTPLRQEEIEAKLADVGGAGQPAGSAASGGAKETATQEGSPPRHDRRPADDGGRTSLTGDDVQFLLEQAEAALASVDNPAPPLPELTPFPLRDFTGSPASQEKATLDALSDVELDLKIELGRTHMHLEDVLRLRRGSVVSLDKMAGDPVEVYVNGRLIARGEVLVLNDNFCVRVAELVAGDDA